MQHSVSQLNLSQSRFRFVMQLQSYVTEFVLFAWREALIMVNNQLHNLSTISKKKTAAKVL